MSFSSSRATPYGTEPWPDRDVLRELGVTPPVEAIRLPQLRHLSQTAFQNHSSRGLSWEPLLGGSDAGLVVRTLRDAGAVGVSCHHLREAAVAAAAGAPSVTILLPPVVGAGPEHVAELAAQSRIAVVVDHYAQAEHLASACMNRSTSIELLLRIDVGRERLGIRPGPDLHDLARGIAALPGVRLAGISAAVSTLVASTTATGSESGETPRGIAGLKSRELIRLLQRCQSSLNRAGLSADIVSIARMDDLPGGDGDGIAMQSEPIATHARTPLPADSCGPFAVIAGVIGRPTRHRAVIDAGRDWVGDATAVVWPKYGHARLITVDDACSVLHVDPAGPDLAIGDVVVLAPPLRRMSCRSVLIHDGDRWRVIAPATVAERA